MDVPTGLGERGAALWAAVSSGDVARDALALEAARTADRLDELDNIIQGKGVLDLMQFRLDFPSADGEPFTVEVKFAAPLAEARQQGVALAGLLTKLGISDAPAKSGTGAAGAVPAAETPLERMRRLRKA